MSKFPFLRSAKKIVQKDRFSGEMMIRISFLKIFIGVNADLYEELSIKGCIY